MLGDSGGEIPAPGRPREDGRSVDILIEVPALWPGIGDAEA